MRNALFLTGDDSDVSRQARAAQGGATVVELAAPEPAAESLAMPELDGSAEYAAPTPALRASCAALLRLKDAHRATPFDEARFPVARGLAWASALQSRQAEALPGMRIVVEVDPQVTWLVRPVQLGDTVATVLDREAAIAALRDADEVLGAPETLDRLRDAGIALAEPRGAARWLESSSPSVSAVVTHKDLGRYLPACLASLRAQTVPVEIIVVDDGSGPQDLAILDAEERANPAMRVIRQPNRGLSAARNTGVSAASGEYVLPVDADNILRPQMIERLLTALRRRPRAAFATAAFRAFEDGSDKTLYHYCPAELSLPALLIENTAGDACTLHRKEALVAAGGFDESVMMLEDWDLWLRYGELGVQGAAVPEVLFDYRVRPSSLLRRQGALEGIFGPFQLAARHPALVRRFAEPAGKLAAARILGDLTLLEQRRLAMEELLGQSRRSLAEAVEESRRAAATHRQALMESKEATAAAERREKEALEQAQRREKEALEQAQRNAEVAREAQRERDAARLALDEMASSGAVRAARLLRSLSPRLQKTAGAVARILIQKR